MSTEAAIETWVGVSAGSELSQVLAQRTGYAEGLARVDRELWRQQAIDPTILALCQTRIRSLLGAPATAPRPEAAGLDPDKVAHLDHWPTDPRFTEAERASLDHAEQVLVDASGVTDERAARAIAAIGQDGFVVLSYACGLFETMTRAELVLGLEMKQ